MSVQSKNWGDLPGELKSMVVGKLDIVGRIQLARTSTCNYESVELCKVPIQIVKIDLMVKNGYAKWDITQGNGPLIQVEYNQFESYVFVKPVGANDSVKVLNRSALDQALQDLCRIITSPLVQIKEFRLFLTADDRNFSADKAHQHFNTLCHRFGQMTHKLKVHQIDIDYSSFTVYEEDMLRGLELLDPSVIFTIVIKGDEAGAILNTRHVMDCAVWQQSSQLICSPAIRQMEAFWDKPDVRTGLVVENGEFLQKLIEHLRAKTDLKKMIIEISYLGDDLLEPEDLVDLLLMSCSLSNFTVKDEPANQRNYSINQKGHHMKMEVTDTEIRFFVVENEES